MLGTGSDFAVAPAAVLVAGAGGFVRDGAPASDHFHDDQSSFVYGAFVRPRLALDDLAVDLPMAHRNEIKRKKHKNQTVQKFNLAV